MGHLDPTGLLGIRICGDHLGRLTRNAMSNVIQYPAALALAVATAGEETGRHCSFCGASERDAYRLIASEAECICNTCVSLAASILLERKAKVANPQPVMDAGFLYCRFCGREVGEFKELLAGRHATICSECIAACVDVLVKTEAPRELAYSIERS